MRTRPAIIAAVITSPLIIAWVGIVSGQTPGRRFASGGVTYVVTVPRSARIIHGETSITLDWGDEPKPGPQPDPTPTPPPQPTPVPPQPNPTPTPTPNPTPTPQTGTLWVTLVLPDSPTVDQAALRTSPTLRTDLMLMNARLRSYQIGEEDMKRLGLADAARQVGAPCLLVQNESGKLVARVFNPSEATITATVKQLRGLSR